MPRFYSERTKAIWERSFPQAGLFRRFNVSDSGYSTVGASEIMNAITAMIAYAPDNPAEAWDAFNIPNGDYMVVPDVGLVYAFRIHLVQEGPLTGKRIIKVRHFGEQVFKGFAFLTRSGGVQIWQRFANTEGLNAITEVITALRATDSLRNPHLRSTTIAVMTNGNVQSVTIRHRCAMCNSTAIRAGANEEVVYCENHYREIPASNLGTPPLEQAIVIEPAHEQVHFERPGVRPRVARAPRTSQTPLEPSERSTPLPMCQVMGRDVQ